MTITHTSSADGQPGLSPSQSPPPSPPPSPSPSQQLPPLAALRAFAVAARTGSLTVAAEALCVTQGAVSRQVLKLEAYYGLPLFRRVPRGLELTEAGRLLAQTAQEAFDEIARTSQLLRRSVETGALRFMVPTCVMLWAMPLLTAFQRRHPAVRIAVSTTLANALDPERFDAGIVYDQLDSPAPHRHPLFAERLTPVCSPRLTEGPAALRHPGDLAHHVLLHARADHDDWRRWLCAAQLDAVDPSAGLDFQTLDLSNTAAAEGYGVALGDCVVIRSTIASGRLCTPIDFAVSTGYGYALRWSESQADRPELARLVQLFDEAVSRGALEGRMAAPRSASRR